MGALTNVMNNIGTAILMRLREGISQDPLNITYVPHSKTIKPNK